MAEKATVKDIEADLKRMLNMSPSKQTVKQAKSHKDVNTELKKTLNPSEKERPLQENASGASVLEEDLQNAAKIAKTNKDIETELKKMLNPSEKRRPLQEHASGAHVLKEDLQNAAKELANQNQCKRTRKKSKNKGKKQTSPGDVTFQNAPNVQQIEDQFCHHQQSPKVSQGKEEVVPQAVKKKKKKKKKKKGLEDSKEATEETDDSEDEKASNNHQLKSNAAAAPVTLLFKYLDDTLTPAVLNELEKEKIYPLKKRSTKFPNAKYFCRLCDYHCDNVPVSRQHANDARHRRRKEIMIQDKKLQALPEPTAEHLAALDELVEDICTKYGLTDQQMANRETVVQQVQELLQQSIPDVQVRMYGSSMTGFALKTSDLNIDLVVEKGANPAHKLTMVYKALKNSEVFPEVKSNFMAKVPAIKFKSLCGEIDCEITVGTDTAYYTSRYLRNYCRIEPRLRKLVVAFRYWAKICQVDAQENGSLPAYSFALMTVYFLQQCKPPVLPVLWKALTEDALGRPKTTQDIINVLEGFEKEVWTSENQASVGQLWRELLMFFGIKYDLKECIICIRARPLLPRSEKKWKSKRVAIEDPFSPKRNIARSLTNTRIYDYFYNCLRKACAYFSLPTSNSNISHYVDFKTCPETKSGNKSKAGTGKMIGKTQDIVRQHKGDRNKADDNEKSDKLDVVEESTPDECAEAAQALENDNIVDDNFEIRAHSILDSSKASSSVNGSEEDGIEEGESDCDIKEETSKEEINIESQELQPFPKEDSKIKEQGEEQRLCKKTVECPENNEIANVLSDISEVEADIADTELLGEKDGSNGAYDNVENESSDSEQVIEDGKQVGSDRDSPSEDDMEESANDPGSDSDSEMDMESPDSSSVRKGVQNSVYNFVFTAEILTDGKGPSIFCQICEKEGHLKSTCPEDQLPDITELPPMTKQHLQMLNQVIQQVPNDFRMSQREMLERENILSNLQEHIRESFPEADLCLFGSSRNGFGFHQSDLDICVTFMGKKPEDLDFVAYIEAICKKLKSHRGLYNVFPITTAKVPIVKFRHRQSQLEGDISLYNILAQQNTQMLYTYSCIDRRVVTLVFAIKVFVKVCDIGDASKGSLSSYAYTLMMLHYLQHTKPPVIPVLQEIHSKERPVGEVVIEGWNAWFYDDLNSLHQVWPDFGKNRQNVGELWLGFFLYYLEEFSFLERVISIRQFEPLTKFEKLWNGRCIAIEDPFDQSHNLGGALSRKMNQYILRTLVHARELYGTPISKVPQGFQSVLDYFFDRQQLTEGEPPSDRLCRVCSKIGHIAKDCPRFAARKEREAAEKKRKEELRKANEERDKNSPSRPNTGRSQSDPSERDSSAKGKHQQYHRTHSYSNDSSDQGHSSSMRTSNLPSQDKYNRNAYSQSPHKLQTQNFQRMPPTQQMYDQQSQGYYAMNQQQHYHQTDRRGWRQIQPPSSTSSGSTHFSRQEHVVAGPAMHRNQGQRAYPPNGNREYFPANQVQPYIHRANQQHPEGQRQVLVDLNSSVIGGQNFVASTGYYTNAPNVFVPAFNMPNVALFAPSMATNFGEQHAFLADSTQLYEAHSARNQPPFFVQGWPPIITGAPLYYSHASMGETEAQTDTSIVQSGQSGQNRMVNVHKGTRTVPDVGITIKNEYYRGQEK